MEAVHGVDLFFVFWGERDEVSDQPVTNNPLPWTRHWLNSRGLQNAPQETEIESYVVGGIKQDVEKDSFKGFKL